MTSSLVELLDGTLCATNEQHRQQCEHQVMHLLHQPDSTFACDLCSFLLSTNIDHSYRQFACILLRRYIRAHWSTALSDENIDRTLSTIPAFTLTPAYKEQVKNALVQIVKHALPQFTDSKSQTALCLILSSILEAEAQESNEIPWKELMEHVVFLFCNAIASDSTPEARLVTDFVTRFLALILEHFSGFHCIGISELLFPHLHQAFTRSEPSIISIASRCRIVQVVQQLLISIEMEAQVGNLSAKQVIDRYLLPWCQEFAKELHYVRPNQYFAIQIRIVSCLTTFIREGFEFVTQFLPELYRPMLLTLQVALPNFELRVVCSQSEEANELESDFSELQDVDTEDTQLGTIPFVMACIEFIQMILSASTKQTREWICASLYDLWKTLIPYLVITEKQQSLWKDVPEEYLADEEDASPTYTIRHAAMDLLNEIQSVIGAHAGGRNSTHIVTTIIKVAKLYLHQNVSEVSPELLWRRQEASLLLLGSLVITEDADGLIQHIETFQESLSIDVFFSQIGHLISDSQQHPLLRGRALWCASHFACAMSCELLGKYLEICISCMDMAHFLPIRLNAYRAISHFLCAALNTRNEAERDQIYALATHALQRLCVLMNQTSDEWVHIADGSVKIAQIKGIRIDPHIAGSVLEVFLSQWIQHLNDPVFSELLLSVTTAFLETRNISTLNVVHEKLIIPMQSSLRSYTPDDTTKSCTAASLALDLLQSMLRHSFVYFYRLNKHENVDTSVEKLGCQLIHHLLDLLIKVMEVTDDERMLHTGAECLKWLVVFSPQALAQHSCMDPVSGRAYSAVERIVQLTEKLLTPSMSDASALNVGGLLTQLLSKCSEMEDSQSRSLLSPNVVRGMLLAVSLRLTTAELPSLIQALCMVFARLIITHGKGFLDELERLPAPQCLPGAKYESDVIPRPKNLLEFVFRFWIEKQLDFYGVNCLKVTLSALLQILEWRDPRVMQLVVHGNEIESLNCTLTQGDTQRRSRRLQARSTPCGASIAPKPIHFGTKLVIVLANTLTQLDEEDEGEWESSDEEAIDSTDQASAGKNARETPESTKYRLVFDPWLNGNEDVAQDEEALNCLLDSSQQMSIGLIVSTVQRFMQDPIVMNSVGSELSITDQKMVTAMLQRSC
ncbi:hypothetical protein ABG067_001526 [Albugo candida]